MARGDSRVVRVDDRLARPAGDDLRGLEEVVVVVRAALGEGDYGRDGRTPATGPAGALLVILTLRRDVPEPHGHEVANIDPDLHGGGATEDVHRSLILLRADHDVLEPQFVPLRGGVDATIVPV